MHLNSNLFIRISPLLVKDPKIYMIEENEIIDRCLRKDRIAQKQLFEKFSKQLFSTAYRIVADYDMAHDVIQESFIEVFRDLKNFNKNSPLYFWIRTIVVRKAVKLLRKTNSFEILEAQHATTQFNDEFTAYELDKAIMKLPPGCRSIFIMVEVEGYKHNEVAEILNITEGTSKSQLHYSKKILRTLLKEMHDGR